MTQQNDLQRVEIEFEWSQLLKIPIATPWSPYPVFDDAIEPHKCKMAVYIQGDRLEGKVIILTIHDIGKNHLSFVEFVNSKPMETIKRKAVFVHICVPGQESDAKDFKENFPTMENLAHGLGAIMKTLKVEKCLVIGEGAGADIACRFAMEYRKFVSALLLIHCTSTTHGIVENLKEIFSNLVLEEGEMDHSAWNYLLAHRFGNHKMDDEQKLYIEMIRTERHMNTVNLSKFIYAFSNREDFTCLLEEKLANLPTLLVTGTKSSHNENVQHMFGNMDKSEAGLLMVPGQMDVLEKAPDYLAAALALLCHRNNVLMDVQLAEVAANANHQ